MKPLMELRDYLKLNPTPLIEIKPELKETIKNKIFEKYDSYKEFTDSIKIKYHTFYNNLFESTKGNRFRLNAIVKVCKKLEISFEELEKNVVYVRPKKYGNFNLPLRINPSPELANLVGHALGDGHIDRNYTFSYTNKFSILQKEVNENISKVLGMEIKPKTHYHKALTSRYPYVAGAILSLAGAPVGNKTAKSCKIPKWIKNGDNEMKKAFIRAIFDDEASVKIGKREIVFKMAKISSLENELVLFLESVICMIDELGLKPSKIRYSADRHIGKNGIKTIQKAFGIHGNVNFQLFSDKIGFSSYEKSSKLKNMIKSCQTKKLRGYEGQDSILELLANRNGMTKYEISDLLSITPLACYKHLKKLEVKNIVVQLKDGGRQSPSLWSLKHSRPAG